MKTTKKKNRRITYAKITGVYVYDFYVIRYWDTEYGCCVGQHYGGMTKQDAKDKVSQIRNLEDFTI